MNTLRLQQLSRTARANSLSCTNQASILCSKYRLPSIAHSGLRVAGSRSFLFDPIFLPVQEAVISFHNVTGIPWYLLIPASGVVHTLLFRMPSFLLARKDRDKVLHGMLMSHAIQAATARAYGNSSIKNILAPRLTSRAYQALGKTPADMEPGKKLSSKALIGISFLSWFYSVSLFRRLTGGLSITGEQLSKPDPSIFTEGCLWFQDLTASDPTYILPLTSMSLIIWSWIPKTEAGWRDVLGKPDPLKPSGMSPLRLRATRVSLIATPLFIAGLDSLTAGSSLFVVSSLLSFRAFKLLDKKDSLTDMRFDKLADAIVNSRTSVPQGNGRPISWFITKAK
ncbi:hypothetical protein HOO65_010712 [Ceratocystis lukuohia]|uniref:Mitochondrial inner membrane protein COX18 n=1 Tax=Ceratocystis lukuohia TaxID=2019550 RepID=A0ABR4MSV2_9PEZI